MLLDFLQVLYRPLAGFVITLQPIQIGLPDLILEVPPTVAHTVVVSAKGLAPDGKYELELRGVGAVSDKPPPPAKAVPPAEEVADDATDP